MEPGMTAQPSAPLTRFLGKKLVFEGQFGYGDGDRERLVELATAQSGTVVGALDPTVDYLVIPDATVAKTAQKKAQSLIKKGATIQILAMPEYEQLAALSDADILALVLAKKITAKLLATLPRDKAIAARTASQRGASQEDSDGTNRRAMNPQSSLSRRLLHASPICLWLDT